MKRVPKLRFKEFSDEWEEKTLGEMLEFKNGINASKEQYGKGIKFINVLDILNNDFIVYDNIIGKVDIDKNTLKKYTVTYGDILFQRSSETKEEVGMTNVYLDKENTATFGGFVIRGKKIGEYIPIFLNKLLKTNLTRNEIISKSGGSTRYNVGQEILKDIKILIPTLQEQEKIANFLSSVDKKITLTEEKLELFKQYKKGIMQKIFSQEMRFKDSDGNDYPAWEEKRLGDILEEYTEKTTINNQYLVLSSTATGIFLQEEYFNRQIASSDNIGYKILKKNQLVFSPQNLWLGNININLKYEIGIVSPSYKVFNIDNEVILTKYLKNIVKTSKMLEMFKNVSEQGASIVRRNLDMKQFINICISLPCIEEQEKIAGFLSSIDEKIESIEKELEGLKEFKKGLLQKMFV